MKIIHTMCEITCQLRIQIADALIRQISALSFGLEIRF